MLVKFTDTKLRERVDALKGLAAINKDLDRDNTG